MESTNRIPKRWRTPVLAILLSVWWGGLMSPVLADPGPANVELQSVIGCCEGLRGNVDGDPLDAITITDLTVLVNSLFVTFEEPSCFDEADLNGDRTLGLSDLTLLVNYLFVDLVPPAACPSVTSIVGLEPDDETVQGTAYVTDPALARVVLWAKTNSWYVQPTVAEPYTIVQNDGSWSNSTNPWERMVALLVDSSYVPGSVRTDHPAFELGVLGWDEYPDRSARFIDWSGFSWFVKRGDLVGPGPNYFADDSSAVWTDNQDRLHLKINFRDGRWYCAEVVLADTLGYGVYTFRLDSRVDSLDYNTIFAGFIYETIEQEIDFEFSQRLADPFNAQYVVQPYFIPGNIEFYNIGDDTQSTHSLEWRSDRIIFTSWRGHADSPTVETLINTWIYTGGNIPLPDRERMRFNLYLFGGEPPVAGGEDHVIIKSFDYSP